MSWLRVVFAGLIVGAVLVVVQSVSPDWGLVEIGAAIAAAIIAIMATLGLVGPFAIGKLAARRHRRARSAHELIPARNVVESPKAAWRQVSGLALACFIVVPTAPVLGHLDLIERGGTPIDAATRQSFTDVRTVVLATVVISFLLVACSVGVDQAAAVLETPPVHQPRPHRDAAARDEPDPAARGRRIASGGSAWNLLATCCLLIGFSLGWRRRSR